MFGNFSPKIKCSYVYNYSVKENKGSMDAPGIGTMRTELNIVHKGSEGEFLRSFFDALMSGSSYVELLPVPGPFSCPDVNIQTTGQRKKRRK